MNPKLIVAHAGLLRDFAALAEEMGMHDEAEGLLEAADECEELDDAQAEALGLARLESALERHRLADLQRWCVDRGRR